MPRQHHNFCRFAWPQREWVRALVAVATCLAFTSASAAAEDSWQRVEKAARGQTVYFNYWGGDEAIDRYVTWAADELRERDGVILKPVKLADTAEAVSRLLAEKAAGRTNGGSVDLIWINGENFASLRDAGLLWGPWAESLPHSALIDTVGNPSTIVDMTLPTGGYEVAWGTARFTLFYDVDAVATPPRSPAALLDWIQAHPGRFTYPQPPNFLGTSFLKQMLLVMLSGPARQRLAAPVGSDFDAVTRPLWEWLDRAHPALWRRGRIFPTSGPAQRRLLGDGEVDFAMAFNPAEASRAIRRGELPGTIRATSFEGGALTNSHFLAIPFNARAKPAAMVAANFLLSPEAQAHKADEAVWGDQTVLAVRRLEPADAARFDGLRPGPATPTETGTALPEPHPSWMGALEHEWARRYAVR